MEKTFMVGVRGESHSNDDGSSRQEIIKQLAVGDAVKLVAQPMNEHDRRTVAVFTQGEKQIGFLPPDARDSAALLRGEPVNAEVYRITGATNWFARAVLRKKYLGVVLRVSKPDPNWSRYAQYCEVAKPIDERIVQAESLEKKGDVKKAMAEYRALIDDITHLTIQDPYASAHRSKAAPVNRLTLCLEKQKKYEEALATIEAYEVTFDPIRPSAAEQASIQKRKTRLLKKLR